MSHESRVSTQIFYALLPVTILLIVDFFALYLQPLPLATSHFALATLMAQSLCLWISGKGQICAGQRGRLINMNKGLLLFYLAWLGVSAFSTYRFLPTAILSLCGIGVTLAIGWQGQKATQRLPFLYFGAGMVVLALCAYALTYMPLSRPLLPAFSVFSQCLTGIILTHLWLLSARSRLHKLMALLPIATLVGLLINAIALFTWLYFYIDLFPHLMAWWVYFGFYLLLTMLILAVGLSKQPFSYLPLLIALIIASSLPLWATFACLPF